MAKSQNIVRGKETVLRNREKRILLSQDSKKIWEETVEKKLDQLRSSLSGSVQVFERVYRADQALKERKD